jgi:HlyD family secretion protein
MKNFKQQFGLFSLIFAMLMISSCGRNNGNSDAYGNFEAEEIIVSAQVQGTFLSIDIKEGILVQEDQIVGHIDSSSFLIKRNQLLAQKEVIFARLKNLDAQLDVQNEQRINMKREVDRIEMLFRENAATQQQFDDLSGKLKVLDSQTGTIKSQRNIIMGEASVLSAQMDEINDMIRKCRVISPITGIVLEKYVDEGELVTPGKSVFKVANVEEMELKVYISGSQLPLIAIGDSVKVVIDSGKDIQGLTGRVNWISSQVEFTPKIIQTRDERVNMVYAVKIGVQNPNGLLKIGMPGEVIFTETASASND